MEAEGGKGGRKQAKEAEGGTAEGEAAHRASLLVCILCNSRHCTRRQWQGGPRAGRGRGNGRWREGGRLGCCLAGLLPALASPEGWRPAATSMTHVYLSRFCSSLLGSGSPSRTGHLLGSLCLLPKKLSLTTPEAASLEPTGSHSE